MSRKFLVLGGGGCRFYFYGREDFSENLMDTQTFLILSPSKKHLLFYNVLGR